MKNVTIETGAIRVQSQWADVSIECNLVLETSEALDVSTPACEMSIMVVVRIAGSVDGEGFLSDIGQTLNQVIRCKTNKSGRW